LGVVVIVLAGGVGILIGMVGVGGVLLAPGLIAAGGMDAHVAAATSTWAFIFTGVVGTVSYAWRGLISWPMLARVAGGIIPAAFLGARANAVLPASIVVLAMAALALFVGVHQLMAKPDGGTKPYLSAAQLIVIGAAVGFGSAVTGTGGPVLLVPVLLMLKVEPVRAVGVSQAAQLPVVISGSVGYLQAGMTDVAVGSVLGVAAAFGTIIGALLATRLRAQRLRQVVAFSCIAAGVLLALRLVSGSP
jgi:uncharacterized protein